MPRPRLVMHSLLLGSISQQGPASRGYDEAATMTRTNSSSTPSLPSTINIPVYLVPVSAFMALLFCLPVMISKCVRATRPVSTTVMPQDAQPDAQAGEQGGAEGRWPSLDVNKPKDLSERELVCSAIELLDDSVPSAFRCAISLAVMRDPVVSSDGHTFERQQLQECISRCGPISPITREAIANGGVPNIALARSMEQWLTERTGVEITKPALQALILAMSYNPSWRCCPTTRLGDANRQGLCAGPAATVHGASNFAGLELCSARSRASALCNQTVSL